MAVRHGAIDGLLIIERPTHGDERGFFRESLRLDELEEALGRSVRFVQENHSRSRRGVLRGLHAENWEKLIYVPHGEVFTAVADIRPHSPTFGMVETFELGESNRVKLFVPPRLAHGFCVLSDEADYVYQVTQYYDGSDLAAVRWNDPDLAVPWPIPNPLLSERDQQTPLFRELFPDRVQPRTH
jgi:dTDP-4-dehydrorhamnose 3,5-epimerase